MSKKITSPLTLSILTGILIGTSTIPFPPWALFFCLSPLLYIWVKESPKKVFWYTTLSFTIASGMGFFWMSFLLHKFAMLPWPVSAFVGFLFAAFCHIHLSVMGYIFAKWIKNFSTKQVLTASALLALSWLVFPLLFPWNFSLGWLYGNLQGYQFMDIIGADGLSALTILINGAFLISFMRFKESKLPLSATVFALILFNLAGNFYGSDQSTSSRDYKVVVSQANIGNPNDAKKAARQKKLNVVVAQANVGNLEEAYQRNPYNYKTVVFDKYVQQTEAGLAKSTEKADLIIWPETAFPEMFTRTFFGTQSGLKLRNYILEKKTNFITGIFARTENRKIANAALIMDANANVLQPMVYKKILLAFGEYLPGEKLFPILRKWLPMVGDFESGESAQVRTIENTRVGIQICYEGIFPSFSRELANKDAEIIVNLTNDSWYGPYSEPWQHMYLWALRAVETRTPMIRATNTGISTVALPDGSLMEQSPLHKAWGGFYKVPLKTDKKKTIFAKWGYAIPLPLILIVFILSLIYGKPRS